MRLRERKSVVEAATRADKKIGGAAEAAAALGGVRQSNKAEGNIDMLAPFPFVQHGLGTYNSAKF